MNQLSTKRFSTLTVMSLVFCIISLVVGCGRIDVNLHTNVTRSGDVIQEISLTGTGMIGGMLTSQMNSADFQGWQTNTTQSGDSTTFKATKTFSKEDNFTIPGLSGGRTLVKNTRFYLSDYLFFTNYHLETTFVGTPGTSVDGSTGLDPQTAEALINSMFSMSWAITFPGNMVTTNADKIDGNTATWNFTYSSFQKDRDILIETRYFNWIAIIGATIGLVLIVLATIFVLRFLRHRQYPLDQPNEVQKP